MIYQMYEENEIVVEKSPEENSIKKEMNVVDDEKSLFVKKGWPEWLPHDWCIHQNIDSNHEAASNMYYSNPKGKRFYSKEDVFQYVATHLVTHKKMVKRTRRKALTDKDVSEEKRLTIIDTPSSVSQSSSKWPEWLPQDWYIERSCDNPYDVYYCSPKWKKFREKDEVLNHLAAQSKKLEPKQVRRKRKNSWAKDEVFAGAQRRRRK